MNEVKEEHLFKSLEKYFSKYALQLYGTSILEKEQSNNLSLKTVFYEIFAHHV